MGLIPFPSTVKVRGVQWQPPFDTAQANRSEFTGGRQVVELPGGGRWGASGEFVPMIGQDASLDVRRFLASLRGPLNFFALPAWEKRKSTALGILGSKATFTNWGNTVVTGRTITKNAGTNGVFDAGTISSFPWAGSFTCMFRCASSTSLGVYAGANLDPTTDNLPTSIDHAFRFFNGRVAIYESGVFVQDFGKFTADDLFGISYAGLTLRYFINGAVVRTVTLAGSLSFSFDSSFSGVGDTITDVVFSSYGLANAGDRSATLNGLDASQLVLRAGWFATALFADGTAQLLTLTEDAISNGSGVATASFDAPLRKTAIGIVTDYPFAHMSLADQAGWSVDPGQIYGAGFTAEESW